MTTFKDVAHLYIGCQIKCVRSDQSSEIERFGRITEFTPLLLSDSRYLNNEIWKPILRNISTMTKDEDIECNSIMHGDWVEFYKEKSYIHYETRKIVYLLSRGFDMFNLIANGQAVKKHQI
jgi:hypothetical protein